MASKAAIYCAGVGSTFAILAVGFAGGVMVADSALRSPTAQVRISSEPDPSLTAVVQQASKPLVHSTTGGELLSPEPVQAAAQDVPTDDQARFQVLRAEVQKRVEDRAKHEKKRYAERKARMIARARVIQGQQQRTMAYAPPEQGLLGSQPSLFNVSTSDSRN